MNLKNNIFLSEKFIFSVIVLNAIIIFLQECGVQSQFLNLLDVTCTVIFIIEMIIKHLNLGIKGYWSKGWNRFDGILVLLSIPSLIAFFMPVEMMDLSFLLALRVLRVFRFFRLVRIFPDFRATMRNFRLAMLQSLPVLIGFLVLIIVFSLISCAIFKDISPQYFATPLESMYSIFRMCTVEGWYEIPDSIAENLSRGYAMAVKIYFVVILVAGGIIGLSLVNSIFVDAMVSDNNNELEAKVDELNRKLDDLTSEIKKLK